MPDIKTILQCVKDDSLYRLIAYIDQSREWWFENPDRPVIEGWIASDAESVYMYAYAIIKGRWPEGEPEIAKSPRWAYYYAANVLKGRFELGEPAIETEPWFMLQYDMEILEPLRTKDLTETYNADNSYLLKYLTKREFDPYKHWYVVCRWLKSNGYMEEVSSILGHQVTTVEQLVDEEPDVFYSLPEETQSECAEWVVDWLINKGSTEAPSWAYLDPTNSRLLHRQTWLVHFTDDPESIKRKGFAIGVDQPDILGLTRYLGKIDKSEEGYNFAFEADSRDAAYAARDGRYGRDAVMFRSSGVRAWHRGDEENQVIFWGPAVDKRDIVVLLNTYEGWVVKSNSSDRPLFMAEDFDKCVGWVMDNYHQYRRRLR